MNEQNNTNDQEMVCVHTLPGILYAEMVKEALENNGIQCVIKSDMLSSGLQTKSAGLADDSCQIWVEKRFVKKAQNIIEGMMDHI